MTGSVIGVGIDLVDVGRLRAALERTPGLCDRVFTAAEIDYSAGHADPVVHLAARFAAKEAVMKALGGGLADMSFADIEVRRDDGGVPVVELGGRAARRCQERGITAWQLSLSHTSSMANAVALALG